MSAKDRLSRVLIALLCIVAALLACSKQNTLKCYSGVIGEYREVPCPVQEER